MSVRPGSNNARLLALDVGERFYVETTPEDYPAAMRHSNTPRTRRPADLAGREFTSSLWTAVGSAAGQIRYLVCVERVK